MQSRLEEEEEAKAALMSRIQRLTKLILVSSKNAVPGYLTDVPSHQRSHSFGEEEVLIENDSQTDASAVSSHLFHDVRHKRSSSRWNEEFSPTSSTVTESTQAGELISGTKLAVVNSSPLTNNICYFLIFLNFLLKEKLVTMKFSKW